MDARKQKRRRKIGISLAVAATLAVVLVIAKVFIVTEPDTAVAFAYFKGWYGVTPSKAVTLRTFRTQVRRYNGGYIPERHDAFLAGRLNEANDDELDAIVNFCVLQAQSRSSSAILDLPGETKARMIESAMARWDEGTIYEQINALIFIESLRTQRRPIKPNLSMEWTATDTEPIDTDEYITRQRDVIVPRAKQLYREWWDSDTDWKQKQATDPLKGSGLLFREL